jgi:CDI immunity protein
MENQRQPLKLSGDWAPEFPVQAFFNAWSDDSLVEIVSHLVNRQGASSDYCHCHFSDDYDPEMPKFEGVLFSHFDDSILITEGRFADVLELVCDSLRVVDPKAARVMTNLILEFRRSIVATDKWEQGQND